WVNTGGSEGLEWLEHAAAATGPAPLAARAEVRGGLAFALRSRGREHRSRCIQLAEEAVAIAAEAGDLNALGYHNLILWELAIGAAQLDRAEQVAHEAEAAYRAGGSTSGWIGAHHLQGWIHIHRREYTQAREHLLAAVKIDRLEEIDWLYAQQLADLALVSVLCGHTEDIDRLVEKAVRVARRLPAGEQIIKALTRAAQATLLSGHTSSARGFLTALFGVLRELGFQRWVADALELTAILLAEAQPTHTATLLGAAGSLRESLAETPAPFITDDLNRSRQQATEALGPVNYGVHERHGRNMTSHEALAYALRALHRNDDLGAGPPPRSHQQPT
ncbi:MAG TPA: hypothetical protein VGH89_35845, partial [Pseudonocardia sp.]